MTQYKATILLNATSRWSSKCRRSVFCGV